jgi:hypothetical protein
VFDGSKEYGQVEATKSADRQVVGFGASGGEENVVPIKTERLAYQLTGCLELAAGTPTGLVQA